MSNRRLVFLAICLALVCLTLFVIVRMDARKDRITWKNIERIQIGMTEAEVEAIFGVPPGNYNATELFVTDDHDPRRIWIGDGPGVALRFDADGRVSEIRRLATPKEMNFRRRVVGSTRNWMNGLFDMMAE